MSPQNTLHTHQDLAPADHQQALPTPRELSPAELLAVAGGLEIVPEIENDPRG